VTAADAANINTLQLGRFQQLLKKETHAKIAAEKAAVTNTFKKAVEA
jgi:hypothetical protein